MEIVLGPTEDTLVLQCPHCFNYTTVKLSELNCCIFRHAIFKHNNEPINPHLHKEGCDELINKDLVYGCARPFKIVILNPEKTHFRIEICDYI